jgi:hypothetical protein
MSAQVKADLPVTLSSLAKSALDASDGDTQKAIDALVSQLSADAGLLRLIIRDAVSDAVSYRVELQMRNKRRQILASTTSTRGAVIALSSGLSMALLDFPLANGLKLREATRADVVAAADRYALVSKDMRHKAKWLQAIAQSIPDGKRVGDVMTDERAAELFKETE